MSLRGWTLRENGNYSRRFDHLTFTLYPADGGWRYAGGPYRAKRTFPTPEAAAHAATGAAAGAAGLRRLATSRTASREEPSALDRAGASAKPKTSASREASQDGPGR